MADLGTRLSDRPIQKSAWTIDQHQVAELEIEAAYWRGHADGYQQREAELIAAAEAFIETAPDAVATPLAERHARLVESLARRIITGRAEA